MSDREKVAPETDKTQDAKPAKIKGSQIKGRCACVKRIYAIYDKTFILQLTLQYFNQGTRIAVTLAMQSSFTNKYGLEPELVQALIAYAALTWSPKLIYGIIADTFKICGSRKKSYFILFSFV